jgi:hypothetical protein
MKLLINVDQRGSIAAGFEAPTSTVFVEVPVTVFGETLRKVVANNYNVKTKRLEINGKEVTLIHPITPDKVRAEIERLYTEWLETSATSA